MVIERVIRPSMRRVLWLFVPCLAAMPAAAAELPKLDSEAFCASVGEGSVMVRQACLNLQKESYEKLVAIKDKITPEMNEMCLNSSASVSERRGYSGANYSSYYECVSVSVRMQE